MLMKYEWGGPWNNWEAGAGANADPWSSARQRRLAETAAGIDRGWQRPRLAETLPRQGEGNHGTVPP